MTITKRYRIGYIDEESGWKNTFYQYLKSDFEVVLFDINEETTAESLVKEVFNQNIDMLVVDFRLDETGIVDFNADLLVEKIQARNFYYPLIILTSYEIDALDHIPNANLVNGKDMLDTDNLKVDVLKQKIFKIANDYETTLISKQVELATLEKKRLNSGLLPDEEDKYIEINNFLDKTVHGDGYLSRSFYSESTNKRLDDLIKITQELLDKLPDNE